MNRRVVENERGKRVIYFDFPDEDRSADEADEG